jgi:hypothetical protein
MPWVFFPGRPDYRPRNPLRAALLAAPAPAESAPPWIRLFQLSSGYPWWLPWRYVARACAGCAQRATFAVWTTPARDRRAYSALCLACGRATSEYVRADAELREAPVSGSEWSPPCVASPACAGRSSTTAVGMSGSDRRPRGEGGRLPLAPAPARGDRGLRKGAEPAGLAVGFALYFVGPLIGGLIMLEKGRSVRAGLLVAALFPLLGYIALLGLESHRR